MGRAGELKPGDVFVEGKTRLTIVEVERNPEGYATVVSWTHDDGSRFGQTSDYVGQRILDGRWKLEGDHARLMAGGKLQEDGTVAPPAEPKAGDVVLVVNGPYAVGRKGKVSSVARMRKKLSLSVRLDGDNCDTVFPWEWLQLSKADA